LQGSRKEKKEAKDKRKDHGAMDITSSEQQFRKVDAITFLG